MSELSNLTRKRLEQYTVGLQNMNAEQREALAAKERELARLRDCLLEIRAHCQDQELGHRDCRNAVRREYKPILKEME